jgi:hypothetical protein
MDEKTAYPMHSHMISGSHPLLQYEVSVPSAFSFPQADKNAAMHKISGKILFIFFIVSSLPEF